MRSPLALAALLAATSLVAPANAVVVDRVVAVVGHDAILLSELRARAKPSLSRIAQRVPTVVERVAAEQQVYRELLAAMVDEKLIAKEAARLRVVVDESMVDLAARDVAQANGVDEPTLYAAAAQQGMDRATYRVELARQLLDASVVTRFVAPRVPSSPGGDARARAAAVEKARRAWLDELRGATTIEVRL